MSAERLIERVIDALERERALLVEGRWDALFDAADRREGALEKLAALGAETLGAHEAALQGVRDAATRNTALLKAAMEGFAIGSRRVSESSNGADALSTYDRLGAVTPCGAPTLVGRRV